MSKLAEIESNIMELKLTEAVVPVKLTVLNTISQSNSRQITEHFPCRSMCSACCFRLLRLTVAEAMVLYVYLEETNQWEKVKSKAKEQLPISRDCDPIAWLKMRIPCPVLDEQTKKCKAYKVRPPFCSTHFVKSASQLCDPWYSGPGDYDPAFYEDLYIKAKARIHDAVDSVLAIELPVQTALLFAEKVSIKSGLTYDQVIRMISNEF